MALPHSLNPLDYPPRFQFQATSPCGGSAACTDTCLQMLIEYWNENTVTLGRIRDISGNPHDCTGDNPTEVGRVVNHYNLPYKYASDVDAQWVKDKLAIGPVLVGVGYRNNKYPTKIVTCGTYNTEAGGKNDCSFTGAHAVLVLKTQGHRNARGVWLHNDVIVRDPDHGSASRPWKPNHDRFPVSKLQTAMHALVTDTAWSHTFAWYPTRKKKL